MLQVIRGCVGAVVLAGMLVGCSDEPVVVADLTEPVTTADLTEPVIANPGEAQNVVPADFETVKQAAEQGDVQAQFKLGLMYDEGQGVAQDYVEAVKWYQKAAGQGDADAQFKFGVCYERGKGVTQDYAKAVEWYTKAAEQGHEDAQEMLAEMKK